MARKDYIVGSGNVFEDLGHPRPAEALDAGRVPGDKASVRHGRLNKRQLFEPEGESS